ncbi:MAG TPA: isoleucine--tRNA ligase [Dehalococcoidia bacterium]|nr:isoleucine--tRNA ligase [Dehalococcoidia bacterium]
MTMSKPAFQPVSSKVDFPALETRIAAFWKANEIFRKSVEQRPEKDLFVFYEGPPTANGKPGIHHVLARAFKDAIPRYQTMRGKRVPRKGGWDTHGLPVELEVERALGLRSKPDIEAYGVEAFNKKCKESVFAYIQDWERMTERIGFWVDMSDAYVTYADSYIESGWWIMKSLWDGGLVFQDYRSAPYCPRCGTGLSSHELSLGYQDDVPDPSVYIKFRLEQQHGASPMLRLGDGVPTFVLAWTTTPWTLPGNTALAVDPNATYALIEVAGPASSPSDAAGAPADRERLILAQPLVEHAVGAEHEALVLGTFLGSALVGLAYVPLYEPRDWGVPAMTFDDEGHVAPIPAGESGPERRVQAADFVSMEEGTGVVHIAPAFGADDLEMGKRRKLLFVQPVDARGNMISPGQPWDGHFVKQADPVITADLRERGLLWKSGTIRHTYPFCWRCDTPLLYYARTSWYIRTTRWKDSLLANNERINWYPDYIKRGRFGDWLENNIDWSVSRERYWGTPMPVWRCESPDCDAADCIGSVAELRERAVDPVVVDGLPELHRPYVDTVLLRCDNCGGQMRRVPEVLDAWYDSGAMPYAQWHYPFENKDLFKQRYPADFICEAIDQTRGWFYTLHAEATLLNAVEAVPEGISYRNVICLGHVLDGRGEKMSKSRGNVVDPWEPLDRYGADATRWYLYTASPMGQPRRFSTEQVGESVRRFLLTLWNTYSFFVTYANLDGWTPGAGRGERSELDRWVLSELNLTVERVTKEFDLYNPTEAGRAVQEFVEDLSNWYVRRSRRRFWKSESDQDKLAAYSTLYTCLVTVAQLTAPLAPFVADELWQNLVRGVDAGAPESVHLSDWPAVRRELIDESLSREVRLVMRLASLGRAARAKARVKVRQPLAELAVQTRVPGESEALARLAPTLLEELNVRSLRVLSHRDGLLSYQLRPNLPKLGPKYGKAIGLIRNALAAANPADVAESVANDAPVVLDGFTLEPDEVLVTASEPPGYTVAQEAGYTAALDTTITPELADEGLARELVHRLQTMRRDGGFEIADRISVTYRGDAEVRRVMEQYADYAKSELLALVLREGEPEPGAFSDTQNVDGREVVLSVRRVGGVRSE